MTCGPHREAFFGEIQSQMGVSAEAMGKIYQTARNKETDPGKAKTDTLRLFNMMRSMNMALPTHSASGLPNAEAQRGYAAVYQYLLKKGVSSAPVQKSNDSKQVKIMTRDLFAKQALAAGFSKNVVDSAMLLMDANAEVWSSEEGRPSSEWYAANLAGIMAADEEDLDDDQELLFQSMAAGAYNPILAGASDELSGTALTNYARALMRQGKNMILTALGDADQTERQSLMQEIQKQNPDLASEIESSEQGKSLLAKPSSDVDDLIASMRTAGEDEELSADEKLVIGELRKRKYLSQRTKIIGAVYKKNPTLARQIAESDTGKKLLQMDEAEMDLLIEYGEPAVCRALEIEKRKTERIRVLQYVHKQNPDLAVRVSKKRADLLSQRDSNSVTKGAVRFLDDGRAIIYALNSPDESTLLHEISHVFRRNMKPENNQVVQAWVKDEYGIEAKIGTDGKFIDDGNLYDPAGNIVQSNGETLSVWVEERFARGFEAYLSEGNAPAENLTGVFGKFKTWLGRIYKGASKKEINVKMNNKIRGLYAKILTGGIRQANTNLRRVSPAIGGAALFIFMLHTITGMGVLLL